MLKSSGSKNSITSGAIVKFYKVIESFIYAFLHYNYTILFWPSLHVQNAILLDEFWQISNNFSVYHTRESRPPAPTPTLPLLLFSWIWLAGCWPWGKEPLLLDHTSDTNSEDWVVWHRKYGRILIGPCDVIRIILIFYNVVLLGGGVEAD